MEVELLYGRGIKRVKIAPNIDCTILRKKKMPIIPFPEKEIIHSLKSPIGSPPLPDLLSPGMKVAVAISDITRPVPNRIILPPLISFIEGKGIRRKDITIITASGTHREMKKEELLELVGEDILKEYRLIQHNARKDEELLFLGETKKGTPIKVNSEFIKADFKIAVGLIEPHFMFGYSGGVKSLAPGLCGMETVKFLHGIDIMADPRSATGVTSGNPCRNEANEIAEKAGLSFIINVVINEERKLAGIFSGDPLTAFEEGACFLDRYAKVAIETPLPVVLTSAAGYPLDTTFYQAVKGMVAPLPIIEENGMIILAAECAEGIGSADFARLLDNLSDFNHFLAHHRLLKNFVPDQWEVQELIKALEKAEVLLYSGGLARAKLNIPGLKPINSIEEGLELAYERFGNSFRLAAIAEGPYIIPVLK